MFKVELRGINGVKRQFASAAKEAHMIVSQEVEAGAQLWVAGAKRDAPKDQGRTTNAISYYMNGSLNAEIAVPVFYAPFMEFGTKGKYRSIPGTEQIAAQFKGYKVGDIQEMLRMITRWVARKGITGRYSVKTQRRVGSKATQSNENLSAAWPIMMSILKNGVNPHPFFFKQQETVWPAMIRNIEKRLEQKTGVTIITPGSISRPRIVTI